MELSISDAFDVNVDKCVFIGNNATVTGGAVDIFTNSRGMNFFLFFEKCQFTYLYLFSNAEKFYFYTQSCT